MLEFLMDTKIDFEDREKRLRNRVLGINWSSGWITQRDDFWGGVEQ